MWAGTGANETEIADHVGHATIEEDSARTIRQRAVDVHVG
jgi:hypothetical protein